MTTAGRTSPTAPYTRRQKQYLALLKLYSDRSITRICRILNLKFQDELFRRHLNIDEKMTNALWTTMEEQRDEAVVWAEREGREGWRTKRVMIYAERVDRGEEPCCVM